MKSLNIKKIVRSIAFLALCAAGSASVAQDGTFFGQEATGKWIIGPKVANIDPNIDSVSDSTAVGIVLGYEFDRDILGGRSSFEIEYLSGDEERIDILEEATYEASVLNAFFTFRSAGDVYFKLKGGLSYVDIDTRSSTGFLNTDFEDTSIAAGVGLGYRINDRGMVEVEYTQDTGDSDLGILGLNGFFAF